jgi:leucyl aminopeptidase
MLIKSIFMSAMFLGLSLGARAEKVFLLVDHDGTKVMQKSGVPLQKSTFLSERNIIEVDESMVGAISHEMHEELHRCGGFFAFNTFEEAVAHDQLMSANQEVGDKGLWVDYEINQKDLVRGAIAQVDALRIEATIRKLSSFNNRYYRAQTGVDSQNWLKETWSNLVAGRSDASVELYQHSSWPQPSVILTIKGKSDEVIVVGGHADSISGYFGGATSHAPGADDNASGIATITEVIRILMQTSYVPEKTLKFMAYAAEEVGLLGSKEIATDFKRRGINVVGVMQLDMTNFNGTKAQPITLISDFTNQNQNDFLGILIDEYVKVTWGRDACGYACSDHASWHAQGYPASTPFESRKNDMNRRIHTAQDTIDQSGGNATHAANFSKLALAYVIELDR